MVSQPCLLVMDVLFSKEVKSKSKFRNKLKLQKKEPEVKKNVC